MKHTHEAEIRDTTGNILRPGMYGYEKALTDAGKAPREKRYLYKTAWTLVGGYGFTSNQCVAVRYIGLKQYRINESPETLHEIHLTDFCL